MVKITDKIFSRNGEFDEVNEKGLLEWLKTHITGYEVLIDGNYIPYYDFDNKYDTEEKQKNNYTEDLNNSYAEVKKTFPEGKIYVFESCGYDPAAKMHKNSFHYRVRGVGYYKRGVDIPVVLGADTAVYKRDQSRQLMRLPFTSKKGNNRPLLRLVPEDGKVYEMKEIGELGESIFDYIIQNISNEKKMTKKKKTAATQPPASAISLLLPADDTRDSEEDEDEECCLDEDESENLKDFTELHSQNDDLPVSIEIIDSLCGCLAVSRFNDREEWLRFIRCLKNIGAKYRIGLTKLIHKYSKLSKKYNKKEVAAFIKNKNPIHPSPLSIGTLCFWAKNDNIKKYNDILISFTQREKTLLQFIEKAKQSKKKYSFDDYVKFVNKRVDEYELIKYLVDTIIHVIDGGKHKLFTYNYIEETGGTHYTPIDANIFSHANNFTIYINENKTTMNKYFLNQYYHINTFKKIDFVPYLQNNPCPKTIFNLFQGFKFPFEPVAIESQPAALELIFYHIKQIVCDNNEKVYEYILNYITHLFQRPAEKIGIALLFQSSEHGTGKNRIADFLMNCLGHHNTFKTNTMEDVCNSFNYHLQGKILIVGDEIANYASHKHADILKALITETTKSITPKGKDSYIIPSHERYIFTSNNDFAFRVEKGDRRLLPLRLSKKRVGDTKYFNELSEIIESDEHQRLFFNYMASRDISGWNFRKIPNTQMKTELIRESLDQSTQFIIDYANNMTEDKANINISDMYDFLKTYSIKNSIRPITERKFTKELRGLGLEKVRKMVGGVRKYVYVVDKDELEKKLKVITNDETFKFDDNGGDDSDEDDYEEEGDD